MKKLELSFPTLYDCSTNKINTIKAIRRLFTVDLAEAKSISEMVEHKYINTINFKPLESEVGAEDYHIEQLIKTLKTCGVIVKDVSSGLQGKVRELLIEAIKEDEMRLAVDLMNLYRDNFQ